MTGLVACVLALDGWAAAGRTVASARRFGLDVVAGVVDEDGGEDTPGVEVHRICWHDDFADARNRLAARVEADWLLWLDADEELTAFDAAAIAGLDRPFAATRLQDRPGYTPRPAVRLQRRRADVRWVGAVNETLSADRGGPLVILDSIQAYCFAHEDPRLLRARLGRDAQVAARARTGGDQGFGIALAEAWSAEAAGHGAPAMMAWLRVFKHGDARPFWPGAPDPRVEAAEWLTTYAFIAPARQLLAENPDIPRLQLALLIAQLGLDLGLDKVLFERFAATLRGGRIDRRYSVPVDLAGAGGSMLRHVVRQHRLGFLDLIYQNQVVPAAKRLARYLVVPTPLRMPRPGRHVIRIDAPMTFGSGAHPATYLSLYVLDRLARERRFHRILDLGAGSGVLSIAAAKTWPARVTAMEANPLVAGRTRRNIRANMLGPRVRVLCGYGLETCNLAKGPTFDLAIANLDHMALARYAPALARRMEPGGLAVLSGMPSQFWRWMAQVYRARGFVLRDRFENEGWTTLVMKAPARARRRG